MPERIPAPPAGYFTLDHGSQAQELRRRTRRGAGSPTAGAIDGALVWAEGAWKPVVNVRDTFVRTVVVDYADSQRPNRAVDGYYVQRVAPERIAVTPAAVPGLIAAREKRAEENARREAIIAEREAMKAEERARAAAGRAAREAGMPLAERLAKVRRELGVALEVVELRGEEVVAAQRRLSEAQGWVRALLDAEAELAAEVGEG